MCKYSQERWLGILLTSWTQTSNRVSFEDKEVSLCQQHADDRTEQSLMGLNIQGVFFRNDFNSLSCVQFHPILLISTSTSSYYYALEWEVDHKSIIALHGVTSEYIKIVFFLTTVFPRLSRNFRYLHFCLV